MIKQNQKFIIVSVAIIVVLILFFILNVKGSKNTPPEASGSASIASESAILATPQITPSPLWICDPFTMQITDGKIVKTCITPKATPTPIYTPIPKKTSSVETIKQKIADKVTAKFGVEHVQAMQALVFKESGFNPYVVNKSSGAIGLFQAYPASKLNCVLEDIDCQVDWGNSYIEARYKNPILALAHLNNVGWY